MGDDVGLTPEGALALARGAMLRVRYYTAGRLVGDERATVGEHASTERRWTDGTRPDYFVVDGLPGHDGPVRFDLAAGNTIRKAVAADMPDVAGAE